ncbi:MAG TPA: biopolymer transporter Tol [Opitutaceae bacterium]|nr:biopolymer transporter Tol [Opitutaceae bacterium]
MQNLLRTFLAFTCVAALPLSAAKPKSTRAAAAPASSGPRDIGTVYVDPADAISINITGSPGLVNIAAIAFNSHGKFRRVASNGAYEFRFTDAGPNVVRVDVIKAGQAVLSQNVSGSSERNALFRAADVAVKASSGLNGYFASKLAFVSERSGQGRSEIFVSDLFLGEARQITHDNAHAMTPRWSPDGTKLLYTSFFKSGFPDIFQIDLSSLQRTSFVSLKGTNTGARYSPTGGQVAMVLSGEGNPEIYVSNAQGRQISRRTRTEGVESSPCFSPDGTRIVYASEPGPQLYIMSVGGGSPRRITSGVSRYCAEPDWSRGDPNKIAFTEREGRGYQIAVVDLSTGLAKTVSRAPLDAIEPSWLPDGRHLVYTARSAGSRRLCILDTETGKSTTLGSVAAEKASVWAP